MTIIFLLGLTNGFIMRNTIIRPYYREINNIRLSNIIPDEDNLSKNKTIININEPLEYYEDIELFVNELELPRDTDDKEDMFPSFNKFLEDRKTNKEDKIIYDDEEIFPSFNKFLEDRKNIKKYFDEADKDAKEIEKQQRKIDDERYANIEPTYKDLILLDSDKTIEWARGWIYDMINIDMHFPKFMYLDMYTMRDYAIENIAPNYYYIGYCPPDIDTDRYGPYYIIALELNPKKRELHVCCIIQNPNYIITGEKDIYRITNFKKEIKNIANDALVFLKIENLKHNSSERYYFTWLYEDN